MYGALMLVSLVAVVHGECPLSTPTLLWSTTKTSTSNEVLQSDASIVSVLRDSQAVYVFYHPFLSMEQFSKQADVYNAHSDGSGNNFDSLIRATQGYPIFAANAISSGERLVKLIQDEAIQSKKRFSNVSFTDFRASSFSNDVEYVLVALPSIDDSAAFSARDFGNVVHDLSAHLKSAALEHTIVYTGLHNGEYCAAKSDVFAYTGEVETLLRRKRQLSEPVTVTGNSSAPQYTYINVENCLAFFTTLIQVGFSTTVNGVPVFLNFPLPPVYSPGNGTAPLYDTANSMCNPNVTGTNMTASLAFYVTNVLSNSSNGNGTQLAFLWMSWQFNQTGTQVYGNWFVTQLAISFLLTSSSPNSTGFPASLFNTNVTGMGFTAMDTTTSANVYAPLADSFHCTTIVMVPSPSGMNLIANITGSSVSVSIQMNDFQVQPFIQPSAILNGLPQFGAWNDCDMFFTIPILMSFFVMVLMLFILLFAFCVFSTLNTYDRFDDKTSVISLGVQDT